MYSILKTLQIPQILIMSYLLVLAAFVSAAVIPKEASQAISPIQSLSQRSALAHDYAIVCAYEKKATNFCQKYYGYGCDASGRVRKKVVDHDCDVLCSCVNLFPKPRCLIGITGAAYCMRSLDEDDMAEQVESEGTPSVPILPAGFEDSEISEALQTTGVDSIAHSNLPQEFSTAAHNPQLATVCKPQNIEDVDRSGGDLPQGTSCDVARDDQDQFRVNSDGCPDLLSNARHVSDDDGTMLFDKSNGISATLETTVLDIIGPDMVFKLSNCPSHAHAMGCADNRETEDCQNNDYCSDNARNVEPGAPKVFNKHCNDECKCSTVGSRVCHTMDETEDVCLVEHMTIRQISSFDQAERILPTSTSTSAAPSLNAQQSEQQNARGGVNLQHRHVVTSIDLEGLKCATDDMAVIFNPSKWFTTFCQSDHGYFCSSSGTVALKSVQDANSDCEEYCERVDLSPMPNCIIHVISAGQCACHESTPKTIEPINTLASSSLADIPLTPTSSRNIPSSAAATFVV